MTLQTWKQQIKTQRSEKNRFFAAHPRSPLPPADRDRFSGLAYYEPDEAYRFELPLHEHDGPRHIQVADTSGQHRSFWRWGEFRFEIAGKQRALQAYRSDSRDERLFVPFKDATNGEETYGAGRYLDLEPEQHLTGGGLWLVDFHQAYNPWCAYSEHYACPYVPPENRLEVAVPAGEKTYPLHEK